MAHVARPPWLSRAFVYELSLDQLGPWGSFDGLSADLDRLDDLGVTALVIGSLFSTESAEPPPESGTADEFGAFVRAARERGIHVLLDVACSPSSVPVAPGHLQSWVSRYGLGGFAASGVSWVSPESWKTLRTALREVSPECVLVTDEDAVWPQRVGFDATRDRELARVLASIYRGRRPVRDLSASLSLDSRIHGDANLRTRVIDGRFDPAFVRLITRLLLLLPGVPLLRAGQEVGLPAGPGEIPFEEGDALLPPRLSRLGGLRRSHVALREGEFVPIDTDQPARVVSFARRSRDQDVLVLANFGRRSLEAAVRGPAWRGRAGLDLLSGEAVQVGERHSLSMGPLSVRVIELA